MAQGYISNIVFCEGDNDLLFISSILNNLNVTHRPIKHNAIFDSGKNEETKIIRQFLRDNKSHDTSKRHRFLIKEEQGKYNSMDSFIHHLPFSELNLNLLLVVDWDNGKTLKDITNRLTEERNYLHKIRKCLYKTKEGQKTFFIPTSLENQILQEMKININVYSYDDKKQVMDDFVTRDLLWIQEFYSVINDIGHEIA
jgi:hypothetical protein